MKKIMMILIAVTFMCTSSFAGEKPEFDVVGCDTENVFNGVAEEQVILNNTLIDMATLINEYSDFTLLNDGVELEDGFTLIQEGFTQTAGQPIQDPCFPDYESNLVTAFNGAIFTWDIVLQMKPETDLDITIRDCVLKANSFDPYGWVMYAGASQTGRYLMPWGQSFYIKDANPRVRVEAFPGEYSSPGFPKDYSFVLDGRTTPNLDVVALDGVLYTSKGLWQESIVAVMPETGNTNGLGEAVYRLKQGDMIRVTINVPENANTVNVNYGSDNVGIKYVGIAGTEYVWTDMCPF